MWLIPYQAMHKDMTDLALIFMKAGKVYMAEQVGVVECDKYAPRNRSFLLKTKRTYQSLFTCLTGNENCLTCSAAGGMSNSADKKDF